MSFDPDAPSLSLVGEFVDAAVQDQAKAERLLAAHPELREARWREGETVLHFCVIENFPEAVRFLGRLGFDVNATSQYGERALGDAVLLGNGPMVELLLELGANPNAPVVSNIGFTPLQTAISVGRAELVARLLRAGADPQLGADGGCGPILELCPPDAQEQVIAALRNHGWGRTL